MVATLTFVADTLTPVARLRRAARRPAGDARVVPARERRRRRALGALLDPRLPPALRGRSLRPSGQWVGGAAATPRGLRPRAGARDPLDARARPLFEPSTDADDGATRPRRRASPRRTSATSRGTSCTRSTRCPAGATRDDTAPARALLRRRDDRRLRRASSHTVTIAADDAADVERARAAPRAHAAARAASLCPIATRTPARTSTVDVDDAQLQGAASAARRSTSPRATPSRSCSRARSRVPRARARPVRRLPRDARAQPVARTCTSSICRPAPGERTRTQIAGASPETMVRLEDGTMTVRPLAGTRPRGKTPEEDAALERELLADPKERAEHVMLIDLGRNDVGRVAEIGHACELVRQMEIERYSHVMHIVSEVHGQGPARRRRRSRSCARRSPPARSRARPRCARCRSSASSRPRPRGIYGGAIGYVAQDGRPRLRDRDPHGRVQGRHASR